MVSLRFYSVMKPFELARLIWVMIQARRMGFAAWKTEHAMFGRIKLVGCRKKF